MRIEHPVPTYAVWKQTFDSDPVGRTQSGVRRYQVLRAVDDPNHGMVDLEFDNLGRGAGLSCTRSGRRSGRSCRPSGSTS